MYAVYNAVHVFDCNALHVFVRIQVMMNDHGPGLRIGVADFNETTSDTSKVFMYLYVYIYIYKCIHE